MTEATGKRRAIFGQVWLVMLGVLVVGFCAVAAMVWLGSGRGQTLSSIGQVLGQSQFRFFLYIAIGSVVALSLVAGFLMRAGRPWRGLRGKQEGTAIIEFALILPIALMIVLLMIQSSLLMGGYLCVNYASFCAARAAVVFVPSTNDDEAHNVVEYSGGDVENDCIWALPCQSDKMDRMRAAAIWAVLPIGDGRYSGTGSHATEFSEGVGSFLSQYPNQYPGGPPSWVSGYLGRKMGYAEDNTWVGLREPANGDTYGEHEDLKVIVRHNLYMSVPYANWLLATLDGENGIDLGSGRYAVKVEIPCTLTNEGVHDTIVVESFP